jgi:hypothetical protein
VCRRRVWGKINGQSRSIRVLTWALSYFICHPNAQV